MFQAVLFDLDGTLLHMDTGEFLAEYLKEISRAAAPVVEPGRFTRALLASTDTMVANRDPAITNAEAFWSDFRPRLADCIDDLEPLIVEFYNKEFAKLARLARPCAYARRAVQTALDQGKRIVLATNPVFPALAIHERMDWGGVADLPWELITSYEEMHFCKPHPEYYLEIAGLLRLPPEECLMVGNDVEEDLAAGRVGMRTFLTTDFLVNNVRAGFSADRCGTLINLSDWLANKI